MFKSFPHSKQYLRVPGTPMVQQSHPHPSELTFGRDRPMTVKETVCQMKCTMESREVVEGLAGGGGGRLVHTVILQGLHDMT